MHQRRREPEFELRNFFGQILRLFVINIPASPQHEIREDSFIYAAIHQANISEPATDHCGINYYQQLGPVVVVDLSSVQCVVGRIRDHNKWAIVDRSGSLAQIHSS